MRNSMISKIGAGATVAAVAGMLALSGATGANAQGISGVTSCAAPGGKQEVGALVGAVVGSLIGNKVGGKHPGAETVVGAGVGAAAGSAIGCKLQHNTQQKGYAQGVYTRNGYRLSTQLSPASYDRIGDTFVAERTVNLRSAPTTGSARVGGLRAGERFEALAEVRGTRWILVGQGGVGVGYVHGDYVRPEGYRYAGR